MGAFSIYLVNSNPMTEPKPYPSIKQGFIIILISISLTLCIYFLQSILAKGFDIGGEKYKGVSTFLSYILLMFGLILYAKRQKNATGNTTPLRFKSFPPSVLIIGAVLVFCIGYLTEIFNYLFPIPDSFAKLMQDLIANDFWSVIMAVVAAPILEEILMRGIILDGFLKRYDPAKSIIWSAIIFGVFHLNPWQAVIGFAAGLLLGWLYWQTKSLWLCILLHAFNNAIASIIPEFVDVHTYPTLIDYLGITNYLIIAAVMAIILVGGILYLSRYFKTRNTGLST